MESEKEPDVYDIISDKIGTVCTSIEKAGKRHRRQIWVMYALGMVSGWFIRGVFI